MKVMFELPDHWVDFESPLGIVGLTLKEELSKALRDVLIEKYLKNMKMPRIVIKQAELKKEVLRQMAQKIIERGQS